MKIVYSTTKLEKKCSNLKNAKREYGDKVGEKLLATIFFIKNAKNLEDVKKIPTYRLHDLKGDRKGQFAIDLGKTLGYRLILKPIDKETGEEIIWDDINELYKMTEVVFILEVSNHYE